jgi:hypothetical protein
MRTRHERSKGVLQNEETQFGSQTVSQLFFQRTTSVDPYAGLHTALEKYHVLNHLRVFISMSSLIHWFESAIIPLEWVYRKKHS